MTHHGAQRERRRSLQGLWLGLGLAAILLAYPLGLALVMLGAPDVWTPLLVLLAALAAVAAVLFARHVRHRQRVHPP